MGSEAGGGPRGGAAFGHSRAVADALDAFQEALGDRYLEVMYCRHPGISGPAHLEGAAPELWDHQSEAARAHLDSGFCKFLRWFADGGRGDGFMGVVCDGHLPPDATG
ncbi:MAG TPA: hypothetical protein VFU12_16860, partial [Glycomyces sp.]|nr:hypothetical protein [Glycomyces sp.]